MQCSARAVGIPAPEATEKLEALSAQEARNGAVRMCSRVADTAAGSYSNDARTKSLLGMGPLTVMDDAELTHLQRLLSLVVEASAVAALWRLTAEAEVLARKAPGQPASRSAEATFEVARDIAPVQDHASVRGRIERAIAALDAGDADTARQLVSEVAGNEAVWLQRSAGLDAAKAAFYSRLLTLAHLADRAGGAGSSQDACFVFAAESLAASLNTQESTSWRSCFLDTDQTELAAAAFGEATRLLGDEHVLTKALGQIIAVRAVRPAEEEWPDENDVRSARIADAQADVPVPERVWAMRNAAKTLALTGAREQAMATLAAAVELKTKWLGGKDDDPRVLGELCDLHSVLDNPQQAAEVAGAWEGGRICTPTLEH